MGIGTSYRRLFAAFYDRAMAKVERLCLGAWRRELLSDLHGDVLEIGSGTGLNLSCYPKEVTRLVLSEPDLFMRARLAERVKSDRPGTEITACSAEQLDFPDQSFDAVVATLVLCSVDHPAIALAEVARVLKPGGRLYFLEHVRSDHPGIHFWQRTLEPLWKRTCGNCHLTRSTAEFIQSAGFELQETRDLRMDGAPVIVRRTLIGSARKV